MVKVFSAEENAKLHRAVAEAEQATSAEIALVVTRMSDEYRAAALICGFALGTIIALLLWQKHIYTTLYAPLAAQLAAMLVFSALPPLRRLAMHLEPARNLRRRAARCAAEEYMHLAEHLPPHVPVVMIYISVAERYVHVHASRSVREKIPAAEWDSVVRTLRGAVKSHGLAAAVVKAVTHAGEMLRVHFPAVDAVHGAENVIELGS